MSNGVCGDETIAILKAEATRATAFSDYSKGFNTCFSNEKGFELRKQP